MALTEIKTSGIADDAVTTDKLANAINTARDANTAKATNATHTGDVTGSGSLTIADNAVTLAKMAGGTDGQIITYDASGDPIAVGPGTDGQVLTSTGAGSPPAFEAIPAGVGGATGVDFNDNVKARFGTGNDLEIFHDASNSYVKDNGTGNLRLIGGNVQILNTAADEYMINAQSDGSVDIFHNGIKQLLTTSDGIEIKPDAEGSNAVLYLTADQGDDNLDKWAIKAASDGTVYHQSYTSGSFVTKFETRAGGDIKVNNGNILMGTSGTGINFSATGDAGSGSNINEVLSDYEQGTWTPTLHDGTATVSFAYYRLIGRQCTVWARVTSMSDTTTNDQVQIKSLPFSPAGSWDGVAGPCMASYCDEEKGWQSFVQSNGRIKFFGSSTGGFHQLRHNELDNSGTTEIYFSVTYPIG